MKFGDLVKSLVSLYITIWLLILKKIKDVYQLEGPNINFGIFLKVFYRSGEKPKRSISMPTIHRSTSIRERRRNKSDPLVRSSKIYDSYSTQNFSLRRKKSWENDIERGAAANSATSDLPYNNEIGKMKIKCKKSLMMARELREDKTALEQQLHKSDDEKISTGASCSPPSPSMDDLPMESLKIFKQRAFTFPNLKNLGGNGRIRTVSERAEEKDQVMPLPVFPKNRRKSCVPPSTSTATAATASSSTPTSGGTTGTKSPTCPSSPENSSRRIVVHHQKKKSSDNNNSWHKLQKSKESDFLKNHNHNAVIVKVAHR